MATTVAKMAGDLELNQGKWETGLKKATSNLTSSKRQWDRDLKSGGAAFEGLRNKLDGSVKGFINLRGAVATFLGGAGFVAITKTALDAADHIQDMSERLKLNTTAVQRYQYAAKLSALETEEFEAAIIKLNTNLAAGKLPYNDTQDALLGIANRVKNAETATQKLAIANEAFGAKMGAKVLPLLERGADGINELGNEAERLGIVLDARTIGQVADFKDQMDTLGLVISRNFQQGFLGAFIAESGQLKDIYSDPAFTEGIKNVGKVLGDFVAWILKHLPEATVVMATFAGAASGAAAGGAVGSVVPVVGTGVGAATGAVLGGGFAFAAAASKDQGVDLHKKLYGDKGSTAVITDQQKINELLENNNRLLANGADFENKRGAAAGQTYEQQKAAAEQEQKAIDAILSGLDKEIAVNKVNIDLFDDKTGALERQRREAEIMNQITSQGLNLSEKEKASLKEKLDLLQTQSETEKKLEEQKKKTEQAERDRQQAIQQFAYSFESAFEDAILDGKKLSDVIKSLAQDLLKLAIRQTITAPLMQGLGSLLPSFSFATGVSNVPYDMNARLHKGETVMTAQQSKALGQGGGTVVSINVQNNNGSAVKAQSQDNANGTDVQIMIDRAVAENMGKPGSQTAQAMQNFNNRSLTRR